MKTLKNTALLLGLSTSAAYAANGAGNEGGGLLMVLFLSFFALIVVFQLLPSLYLFFSMVKGLFSSSTKETTPAVAVESEKE